MAFQKKNVQKAAHAYGPTSDSAFTPVLPVGASIIDTIIDAEAAFDALDVPKEGRIIVLCPSHKAKLKKEDKLLFKDVFGKGGSNELYGFEVYLTTVTPKYNNTNNTKVAFGSAAAGTDIPTTLFYS